LGGIGGGLAAATGAGAAVPAYKLFKTILRSKSPTLRNHYFNIIKGAASGNSAIVLKNAKALDKELMSMDKTGEIENFYDEDIINHKK